LRYTRSKSTPLLHASEEDEQLVKDRPNNDKKSDEHNNNKGSDAFTMVKERSAFDRNFPTLLSKPSRPALVPTPYPMAPSNTPSVVLAPSNGAPKAPETGNAWKSSQNKPIPLNGASSQSGNNSPPTGHLLDATEIQLASCLVPTVQPPKVLTRNRVELLTKKGPVINPKKKFDISPLRKATSEPTLPIPPAYQENYSKLMAAKKAAEKDKQLKAEKPKSGTVVLNRNDFFKGLVRKDSVGAEDTSKQHRRVGSVGNVATDDHSQSVNHPSPSVEESAPAERPAGVNANGHGESYTEVNTLAVSVQTQPLVNIAETLSQLSLRTNGNINTRSSSPKLAVSLEDEERFLRDLGWLPEEEAHVPELTEEEIQESALKLQRWMAQFASSHKKRLNLDVLSIKKWQSEQFATRIY